MRKYGRIDDNQKQIVAQLRQLGASVVSTASIGNGFPDLIAGYQGVNYLLEVKDGSKPLRQQQLTEMERLFHSTWRGSVHVINNVEDAMQLILNSPAP